MTSDHIASAVPLRGAPAMRAGTAGLNLTDVLTRANSLPDASR